MCPTYLKLQLSLPYLNGFRIDICGGIVPLYDIIEPAAHAANETQAIWIYYSQYRNAEN